MNSIKEASDTDKKNSKIFKKTKLFFSKRKSKHSESLNLDNSISYISNKEDSNRTLNIVPQNDGDEANLKQNKPILSNSDISLDEKNNLNNNIDDLDMKINDINNSFKNMTNEWHSNNAEISERLNCLMWQMNQFQKEQTELSQKIENDVNNMKKTITNESQKTINLEENIKQIKKDSERSINENDIQKKKINEKYNNQQSELQNLNSKLEILKSEYKDIKNSLNERINGIEKSSEKSEDLNKIQKEKFEELFKNQESELMDINSKLKVFQNEFEEIKEKVLSFNANQSHEEVTPKKIDKDSCNDNLIEYITKSVYEKIEQQYKFNELELSRVQNQNLNNINVKINELSEKLDEFQVYQLSREVEWYQMKLKLDDTMNKINKEFEQSNSGNKDKIIEKWNNENNKLKETQEKINRTIFELQNTLDDVKTDIYESLNKQQNTLDNISKTTELLQKENEIEKNTRDVNEINVEENNEPIISGNIDDINKIITSLSDDVKILNMETKVMTTNISLLWEDVRSIKNFINQYDMNERLKEKEYNDKYSDIRSEINDLKKRLNEL
ncbi:hypothetical protein PIROE2DRAFT_57351 [Piromyces sp. E2]|nr:hypothetical protein PIROE2DRAFT_57351 [Piromyces sp. E2]|eukprot:OUM69642.1 hypothetical protein PIROE2DRAFT_57351 [Piromyces sp. E2]